MSSVLVVTVPSALDGDLYQMRNYVKESLELGVLIVGKGVQWELLGGKLPMETWRAVGSALDRLDPEG